MNRRDFCNSVFLSTFLYVAEPTSGTRTQESDHQRLSRENRTVVGSLNTP